MTSDFDFGDFGANQDPTDLDLTLNGASDIKPTEEETWGYSAANKKDKKKKAKDVTEEKKVGAFTALPEPEQEKVADETWGAWDSTNKDKKKGKKGAAGIAEEDISAPASETVIPIADDGDEWASFGLGKKDKKKVKKVATEDFIAEEKAEAPPPEPATASDWAQSVSKKDKKSKKRISSTKSMMIRLWQSKMRLQVTPRPL